jgi:hypothetical protein
VTHGVGSSARYSGFGTIAGRFNPRSRRFFFSLSRIAAATLGIGVSRDCVSFARSCSPVGEHCGFFGRLCRNVGGFFALPDDVDAALGVGLERSRTCSCASCPQYRSGNNLQIQDRKASFSGVVRRVSKGS